MKSFDHRFLWITAGGFLTKDLCFLNGPSPILEPMYSDAVGSMVKFSTVEMAKNIESQPNVSQQSRGKHAMSWKWQAKSGNSVVIWVDDDNTSDDGTWIASLVKAECTYAEFVEFWTGLKRIHPAIYLHNEDCRMFTPCSLLEERAVPALAPAFLDPNASVREQAVDKFHSYGRIASKPRTFEMHWRQKTKHMVKSLFDLCPPVASIHCADVWHVDNWISQMAQMDKELGANKINYFSYHVADHVKGRYRSGFMVWVREIDLDKARDLAIEMKILA